MATKKAQKKQAAKPKPKETVAAEERRPAPRPEEEEELVVFAFRLTEAERNSIHKAAGPSKASKFVRSLAIAATRGDEAAVKEILKSVGKPAA